MLIGSDYQLMLLKRMALGALLLLAADTGVRKLHRKSLLPPIQTK
ncbi:hypothetical protein ACTHO0_16565 [Cytobacillus praedii]|nr:hypothetical protein [Cytobacillus praedii]